MRMFEKNRRIRRTIVFTLISLTVLSVFFWRTVCVVYDLSQANAKYITNLAINSITAEYLAQCAGLYDGILVKEKSDSGSITAVNTDIVKVNMLQTEIAAKVLSKLKEKNVYDIKIPVLNLLGMRTLTAWGPQIKMALEPSSNVTAKFEDSFTSAGINQTKFSVNLVINVNVLVSVSPMRSYINVSHTTPVVQLILVGDVPNTFADISR